MEASGAGATSLSIERAQEQLAELAIPLLRERRAPVIEPEVRAAPHVDVRGAQWKLDVHLEQTLDGLGATVVAQVHRDGATATRAQRLGRQALGRRGHHSPDGAGEAVAEALRETDVHGARLVADQIDGRLRHDTAERDRLEVHDVPDELAALHESLWQVLGRRDDEGAVDG